MPCCRDCGTAWSRERFPRFLMDESQGRFRDGELVFDFGLGVLVVVG